MQLRFWISSFRQCQSGALSLLLLILFPLLLVIGGIATDISLYNAQKRYVQSQADLAVASATRHLPDLAKVRSVAQEVISANGLYGAINLRREDVVFGSFSRANGFVRALDQDNPNGVNAVRVHSHLTYRGLLLANLLTKPFEITREATGSRSAYVVFTLRNRLLALNTNRGLLGGLLNQALGINANLLDYSGLLAANIDAEHFIGLAVRASAVTFQQVLSTQVTYATLLRDLLPASVLTGNPGLGRSGILGNILLVSPELAQLQVGNVLPDISLNVLDTLTALAMLSGKDASQRIGVSTGLNLGTLSEVTASLGLIRPPVTVITRPDAAPPLQARLAQTSLSLTARVAEVLGLGVELTLADASASLVSFNCGARDTEVLARFNVTTAPATLGLTLSVLEKVNNKSLAQRATPVSILGTTNPGLTIRANQLSQPVAIQTTFRLAELTGPLQAATRKLRDDVEAERPNCGFLGLNCVVGAVFGLLFSLVNSLVNTLNNVLTAVIPLDPIVNDVLRLLGIELAQAELILQSYSCGDALVQ